MNNFTIINQLCNFPEISSNYAANKLQSNPVATDVKVDSGHNKLGSSHGSTGGHDLNMNTKMEEHVPVDVVGLEV